MRNSGKRRRVKGGKRKRERPFWKELPLLVGVALGLAWLIKTFLVQAFYIPSGSMMHTLEINDRVIVNKLAYRFGEIQRGDVVVFSGEDSWRTEANLDPPPNAVAGFLRTIGQFAGFAPSEKDFIKRVIGLPGDKVKCCDFKGRMMVNGKPLEEKAYVYPGNPPSEIKFETTVPEGRVWVMGDHRSDSWDSRYHRQDPGGGAIEMDNVVGRAFVVVWPIDHWALLETPSTFEQPGLTSVGLAVPMIPLLSRRRPLRAVRRWWNRSGSTGR